MMTVEFQPGTDYSVIEFIEHFDHLISIRGAVREMLPRYSEDYYGIIQASVYKLKRFSRAFIILLEICRRKHPRFEEFIVYGSGSKSLISLPLVIAFAQYYAGMPEILLNVPPDFEVILTLAREWNREDGKDSPGTAMATTSEDEIHYE